MIVEYLFTVSKKKKAWGSKLISWSTGKLHPEIDGCSHVAIRMGDLVLESTLSRGVDIVPYSIWIKNHRVVHAFECSVDRNITSMINTGLKYTYDKGYDYMGILFFAWRMLGFLLFKKSLPVVNRWHSDNKFFCVEVIGKVIGEDYQMMSPIQLVYKFKKSKLKQIDVQQYEEIVK